MLSLEKIPDQNPRKPNQMTNTKTCICSTSVRLDVHTYVCTSKDIFAYTFLTGFLIMLFDYSNSHLLFAN